MTRPVESGEVERYPEHAKLQAVQEASQAIGEFLDIGLAEMGLTLCRQVPGGDNGEPQYKWREGRRRGRGQATASDFFACRAELNPAHEAWREYLSPVGEPIQNILARYFEIDLDAIESEKRQMLDELRDKVAKRDAATR